MRSDDRKKKKSFPEHIKACAPSAILGVVSAFVVPSFLSLSQSTLVVNVISSSEGGKWISDLLVFCGFCIVFSFSSRVFLDGISERLLQKVKKAEEKAEQVAEKAEEAAESVIEQIREDRKSLSEETILGKNLESALTPSPIAAKGDVAEPSFKKNDEAVSSITLNSLPNVTKRILEATAKVSRRSALNISKYVGIPKSNTAQSLVILRSLGLVKTTISSQTGNTLFSVTEKGKDFIEKKGPLILFFKGSLASSPKTSPEEEKLAPDKTS